MTAYDAGLIVLFFAAVGVGALGNLVLGAMTASLRAELADATNLIERYRKHVGPLERELARVKADLARVTAERDAAQATMHNHADRLALLGMELVARYAGGAVEQVATGPEQGQPPATAPSGARARTPDGPDRSGRGV